MLGNRGSTNQLEYDAFSKHVRHWLRWRRGELRQIKRGFSKRMRRSARLEARNEVLRPD
jgi:hypothetical protein